MDEDSEFGLVEPGGASGTVFQLFLGLLRGGLGSWLVGSAEGCEDLRGELLGSCICGFGGEQVAQWRLGRGADAAEGLGGAEADIGVGVRKRGDEGRDGVGGVGTHLAKSNARAPANACVAIAKSFDQGGEKGFRAGAESDGGDGGNAADVEIWVPEGFCKLGEDLGGGGVVEADVAEGLDAPDADEAIFVLGGLEQGGDGGAGFGTDGAEHHGGGAAEAGAVGGEGLD